MKLHQIAIPALFCALAGNTISQEPSLTPFSTVKDERMRLSDREEEAVLEYLRHRRIHGIKSINAFDIELRTDVSFIDDRGAGELLKQSVVQNIEDLLAFCKSPYVRRPDYRVIVPSRKDDIKISGEFLPIYLLAKIENTTLVTCSVFTDSGLRVDKVSIKEKYPGTFNVDTRATATRTGTEVVLTPTYVLIDTSLKDDAVWSAPSEILHCAFNGYRNAHINSSVKHLSTIDEVNEIISQSQKRDEGIVHALALEWMESHKPRLGMPQRYIDNKQDHYNTDPMYRFVHVVRDKIRKVGVQKVIELYVRDPEQLLMR